MNGLKNMVLYTMEYYSDIKKSEFLWFTGRWVELENIMLSEVSQDQKGQRLHVFSCMWKIDTIQIQALSYKVGLLKETKRGRIEEKEW
jgi:hypothetical protein